MCTTVAFMADALDSSQIALAIVTIVGAFHLEQSQSQFNTHLLTHTHTPLCTPFRPPFSRPCCHVVSAVQLTLAINAIVVDVSTFHPKQCHLQFNTHLLIHTHTPLCTTFCPPFSLPSCHIVSAVKITLAIVADVSTLRPKNRSPPRPPPVSCFADCTGKCFHSFCRCSGLDVSELDIQAPVGHPLMLASTTDALYSHLMLHLQRGCFDQSPNGWGDYDKISACTGLHVKQQGIVRLNVDCVHVLLQSSFVIASSILHWRRRKGSR